MELCEDLLGNRGSEPNVPARVTVWVSPWWVWSSWRRIGREGLPLQPKGNILAGMLSLGPTWWAHHPFLHKQSMGRSRACAWSPRAHMNTQVLCGSGDWAPGQACRPGWRGDKWAIIGLRKGYLLKPVGKQVRTRAGKFSLGKKKIMKSCKLTVHVCHSDPSLQNLRQQRTETKAGIS